MFAKLYFIKIKTFVGHKNIIKNTKRQSIQWEKIFAIIYLVRDKYAKYIMNCYNSKGKKITQFENVQMIEI